MGERKKEIRLPTGRKEASSGGKKKRPWEQKKEIRIEGKTQNYANGAKLKKKQRICPRGGFGFMGNGEGF